MLAENPYWTVRRAAQRLAVAYTTAQRAIDKLVSLGILSRTTDAKRNRVYCARPILDVLEEPANLTPLLNV
jgi:Fic family protein